MIAVAGCVAQAEGPEIVARAKVDVVVGPQAYHKPPRAGPSGRRRRTLDRHRPARTREVRKAAAPRRVGPSAFLTVQEGCDKFCTYCVVPYTRGAEISRPFAAIVDEAKALVDAGAREITLLGQNVNAWESDGDGLHDLIRALDRIPGLARLRYTTSHPNDMSQGLIDAHRDVETLMPFLHLPVQAGSDRVLRAMNRSHTRDSYLRLLDRIRAVRPDIALSGDFIVGFPGETEAEFAETLGLVDASATRRRFRSNTAPVPAPPPRRWPIRSPPRSWTTASSASRPRSTRDQQAFNTASVGRTCPILIERRRQAPRPDARQVALAAIGPPHDRRDDRRSGRRRPDPRRPQLAGGSRAGEAGGVTGAAVPRHRAKVPAITLGFWLIKILATTLGETGGDTVSMTLDWGYLAATALFAAVLVTLVWAQVVAARFNAWLYWATIIASTTAGTTLADFATRSLGIGYAGGSLLLLGCLLACLAAWRATLGTVAVASISTPRAELFYWLTITFSQTLGTALGDWTADTGGIGYLGAAAIFGIALVVLALLYSLTRTNRVLLFWAAFVLTRPLGATVGDATHQVRRAPHEVLRRAHVAPVRGVDVPVDGSPSREQRREDLALHGDRPAAAGISSMISRRKT